MQTRIIEVQPQNVGLLNHSAVLLTEYFLHVAKGEPSNMDINDWHRLSTIITNTQAGKHRIFLAFADDSDTPVGIGGINRQGCACHLYILPTYRGKGIAKKLVTARFDAGAWFTTVLKSNFASLSLMKKMGLAHQGDYENLSIFTRGETFGNFTEDKKSATDIA